MRFVSVVVTVELSLCRKERSVNFEHPGVLTNRRQTGDTEYNIRTYHKRHKQRQQTKEGNNGTTTNKQYITETNTEQERKRERSLC